MLNIKYIFDFNLFYVLFSVLAGEFFCIVLEGKEKSAPSFISNRITEPSADAILLISVYCYMEII